jgi:hypothetical protein
MGHAIGHILAHLLSWYIRTEFGEEAYQAVGAWCAIVFAILIDVAFILACIRAWRERPRLKTLLPVFFMFLVGGGLFNAGGFFALRALFFLTPQQRAEAAVLRLNGELARDENAPGKPIVKVSFRGRSVPKHGLTGDPFSRLTDADLAGLRPHLEALSELRELDLAETSISDEGLTHLKGLKQLKTLQLSNDLFFRGGRLTRECVEDLRKALPNTEVDFFDPQHDLIDLIIRDRLLKEQQEKEGGSP